MKVDRVIAKDVCREREMRLAPTPPPIRVAGWRGNDAPSPGRDTSVVRVAQRQRLAHHAVDVLGSHTVNADPILPTEIWGDTSREH